MNHRYFTQFPYKSYVHKTKIKLRYAFYLFRQLIFARLWKYAPRFHTIFMLWLSRIIILWTLIGRREIRSSNVQTKLIEALFSVVHLIMWTLNTMSSTVVGPNKGTLKIREIRTNKGIFPLVLKIF